jgi:hypothetical protein
MVPWFQRGAQKSMATRRIAGSAATSLSSVLLALLVGALGACSPVANAPAPGLVAALDEPAFRCKVEPILIRDCGYMACHGQAGSPLRLYSIGKLRLGDSSTLAARTAPLTDAERHLNFLSAQAFAVAGLAPEDNWLVRKPLPAADGGFAHLGGAIWGGLDDARVKLIRDWLAGGSTCP